MDRIHRHMREDEEAFGAIRELPTYPSIFERSGRLVEDVSSHRSRNSHSERAHSAAGSQHSRAEQEVQQVVVRGPDRTPRVASIAPARAASVHSSGSCAREAPAPVAPSRAASVRSSGSRAMEAPAPVAPSRAGSVRSSGSRAPTHRPSDSQARYAPSGSSSTSHHLSRHPLFDAEVRPEDSVSQAASRASRASSAARSHATRVARAPSVVRAPSSHSQSHSHHTPSHAGCSHENQYYRDPANPNVLYHSSAHSRPGR